jgi:cyclic 2,3-diphosphoglycerate synthase
VTRTLVLVDGEHHPPVTLAAVESLRSRGHEIVAAVNLGGGEKLDGSLTLGDIPLAPGATRLAALRAALTTYAPEVVYDLSDAPVVDDDARALLGGIALAHGARYEGAGFSIAPAPTPRLLPCPQIVVAGTGKRTGKTAVAAALARHLRARGVNPVLIAMGRGGPAAPTLTRGDVAPPSIDDLIALAEAGEHAATDAYEDAIVAGCATVGARRAGGGLSGATAYDTVAEAAALAATVGADVAIFEGSGTAIPPAAADAFLLVAGPLASERDHRSFGGVARLLRADLVVATMREQAVPAADPVLTTLVDELGSTVPTIGTAFHPTPLEPVAGKKILYATTAPLAARDAIAAHLRDAHGAHVVAVSCALGNRSQLREELQAAEGTYEVLVTEIKAAGIDVAARAARETGAHVVAADNVPVALHGDLDDAFDALLATARQRHAEVRA